MRKLALVTAALLSVGTLTATTSADARPGRGWGHHHHGGGYYGGGYGRGAYYGGRRRGIGTGAAVGLGIAGLAAGAIAAGAARDAYYRDGYRRPYGYGYGRPAYGYDGY
ncbi:hypothetical protein [Methylorubrum salsuginis]|uniref:Transmembrane protein n=1 Tax=Methylorubrum salsuginis TaxID=414703 RepID=A0A1I4GNA7_9HYPH|nr:hypothetical protein [Methylorubrum salsuginis]SFL31455.1 hypothetical protein SAMN04488125_112150 [Methylorubrum salsuginis]